jgi:diguanylate cyclase (GGDEF)-like protein
MQGALNVASAIQKAIAKLAIPHDNSDVSDLVTLSIGIASLIPTLERSPEDLISRADQAMYEAKNRGRNRAIAYLVT